ncbi:ThiF family adenylyltransferase [Rhizobium leguminosarum]|uniref:ThiF family adenylyltransferase n=1 Tax=Rhizobium leguminosarum TaxID=384 RepID=UPI001C98156D|nr:ThiF family adenylyltransferase [Rhizobium leguminosarum]MBY5710108.1 hypothetical protein [Rhizobium leguminosarum]
MNPAQENAMMLASILGIDEGEAASRLEKTILITTNGLVNGWAREIQELLQRTVRITLDSRVPANLELVLGQATPQTSLPCLYAAYDERGVTVAANFAKRFGHAHPLFAYIGAIAVAAASLSTVIGETSLPSAPLPLEIDFNEVGVPAEFLNQEFDLSGAVLIGAGAVAHGFLRACRFLNMTGELTIVDPKKVGAGNPNRCLFLDESDVGQDKALALRARAQSDFQNLRLTSFVGEYREFVKQHGPSSTAIVTVDSRRARRKIQSELPGRVFDASTTDIQAVVIHSHRQPNPYACLSCIYKHIPDEIARERSIADGLGVDLQTVKEAFISEDAAARICRSHPGLRPEGLVGMAYDSLFKQLCGEHALRTREGKQVLAPFAFVSMLAGVLLACEFVRSEGDLANTNYWTVDPWRAPIARLRRLRPRLVDCEFCSKPSVDRAALELWS